jgi:hypothetical protein
MSPDTDRTFTESHGYSADVFLRSINLCYDAEHPERIAHYHPTAKSAACLRALAGFNDDRTFFIVAPYGSGKSLLATYLLHLIENRPEASLTLLDLAKRLERISPELGDFARKRRTQRRKKGLVLALHGYARSLPQALKSAALAAMQRLKLGRQARPLYDMPCEDIDQAIEFLSMVRTKAREARCDRIVLLWDEFGRHLESLLADGHPSALVDIQTLAEFVSRSRDLPMTFGLFLHQDLLRYAGTMPQSVRAEWTKIEGRFRTMQYIDDSKELYRLIAAVVSAYADASTPPAAAVSAAVDSCTRFGLFKDFTEDELCDLLSQAYPLEPVTLYLLPRLSARVAQHERTLFGFLHACDLGRPIGPEALYEYFSPVMRADTAVGGTYRQWLETQSALAKVGDTATAAKVIKTACLLGLGTNGERARVPHDVLRFAVQGYHGGGDEHAVILQLVEQKLLLHRQHSDEITVWHGTDVDLRGRLEDEKYHYREPFKLLDFLAKETPPPIWRPVQYNDDFCIRRYVAGEYHSLETLKAYLDFEFQLANISTGCDGQVLYVLGETSERLREAEAVVGQQLAAMEPESGVRMVVALPREPLPLFETALEVACLLRMQVDADLVESDPLVLPELHQMTDDARGHLQQLLDRLVHPGPHGPRWFHGGRELPIDNVRDLRQALSEVMRHIFPLTPRINNEMIVRHKPSPQLINARKKLVLGILERTGQANFGIEGNFPDASMFRTVLLHTGIYQQDEQDGRWRFAQPDEVHDPGLRAVWTELHGFFTEPAAEPKQLRPFFDKLMQPPFGLRAGLLPILFAAALKAFPSALALTKEGSYITDILPSEIEQLCREPALYRLRVLELSTAQRAYLHGLYTCLHASPDEGEAGNDLIRRCFDALEQWKMSLPPAALVTKQLSEHTRRLQAVLRRHLDPVHLLLDTIPTACGYSVEQSDLLLHALEHCMRELEGVAAAYRTQAAVSMRRALAFGREHEADAVRDVARQWATCFSGEFLGLLTDGVAKGVVTRMRTPYDTDDALLESLASLLVGKSVQRWDDSTLVAFDRELQTVVRRIEETAITNETQLPDQGAAVQGLTTLICGRMSELFERLVSLVGPEQARETLTTLHRSSNQHAPREDRHGDDCGSRS